MSSVKRKPLWDLKVEVILSDGRRIVHREQMRADTMDDVMDRGPSEPEQDLSEADHLLIVGFHLSVTKRV